MLCAVGLIVMALVGMASAHADPWAFFHSETVIQFGCSVSEVQMSVNGVGRSEAVWEAMARAKRKPPGEDWAMTVGIFPQNLKGRHAAEKACSKWMDEAAQRLRRAH